MPVTRLFSPKPLSAAQRLTLDDSQSRYLGRALRMRVGQTLTMFDGNGAEYPATITRISGNQVAVELGQPIERMVESALHIRLVQGVSKGDRMDTVVQKATELGVAQIDPVVSQYTVVKLDGDRAAKRQQHWRKIARSACEQCGRNVVPEIDEPRTLSNWFGRHTALRGTRLILHPEAAAPMASSALSGKHLTILIGPEGGFSNAEYDSAAAAGFQAVSLGPRVLRTETAAVAAISVAQAVWGDLS